MTKKEMKRLEEIRLQKKEERREFLNALNSYWLDVEALERVARIKKEEFTKEDRQLALERYQVLGENGLTDTSEDKPYVWEVAKVMSKSKDGWGNYSVLEVDDYIHNIKELLAYIYFIKKFGYEEVLFADRGSEAMKSITMFVNAGAKVVGTYVPEDEFKNMVGLKFDVSELKDINSIIDCWEEQSIEVIRKANYSKFFRESEIDKVKSEATELKVVYADVIDEEKNERGE